MMSIYIQNDRPKVTFRATAVALASAFVVLLLPAPGAVAHHQWNHDCGSLGDAGGPMGTFAEAHELRDDEVCEGATDWLCCGIGNGDYYDGFRWEAHPTPQDNVAYFRITFCTQEAPGPITVRVKYYHEDLWGDWYSYPGTVTLIVPPGECHTRTASAPASPFHLDAAWFANVHYGGNHAPYSIEGRAWTGLVFPPQRVG